MVHFPKQAFDKIITYCGDLTKLKQMERHAELVQNINMFSTDWLTLYYSFNMEGLDVTPYTTTRQQITQNNLAARRLLAQEEVVHDYITLKSWRYSLEDNFKPLNFYKTRILQDNLPTLESVFDNYRVVDALTYKK